MGKKDARSFGKGSGRRFPFKWFALLAAILALILTLNNSRPAADKWDRKPDPLALRLHPL